jgi:two-component system, sensor histidine kinase and response regulator
MPDMTGIEFMEKLNRKIPPPIKIILTAHLELGHIINALNEGKIFCYLGKPWNFDALESSIENAYLEYCKNTIPHFSKFNYNHKYKAKR